MKKIIFSIIDFLFPSRCLSCGRNISISMNGVCKECIDSIDYCIEGCPLCSGEIVDGKCSLCSDRKFYIKKNYTAALYKGTMKEIIHKYKFYSRKKLSKHLSAIALNKIRKMNFSADLITSVPMTGSKKYKRGFNQSELIAKSISRELKIPYARLLYDKGVEREQKKLGYNERFLNTIGRYSINKRKDFKNKNILIIDDVLTTGATINECGRVLGSNGAADLYSLTIARTDNDKI